MHSVRLRIVLSVTTITTTNPHTLHSMLRFRFRSTLRLLALLVLAGAGLWAGPLHAAQGAAASQVAPEGVATIDARIAGVVLSVEGGVPVPGVLVEVLDSDASLVTRTDRLGRFSLSGIPIGSGSATLRLTRLGFAPLERRVELSSDGTIRVELELERRTVALDPVAVLVERTRMVGDPLTGSVVPGSAFHLTREELRESAMAFANVHDVLRQVPGVTVYDEEGFGLRPHIGLRGAGAERASRVTLMEDGVLIAPAPYAAPAAYHFPVVGRMDGVEVRKGASQIRYGPQTLGGAVNLVSAGIPERRSWMADLSTGAHGMLHGHLRAGDSGEHLGWLLEGYQIGTDGFKELQGGGDTGFDTRDFQGRLRLGTGPEASLHQQVELKVALNEHTSDETYLGLTQADFERTPNLRYAASSEDVMDTEHRQLQLRYFVRPTESTEVVVTGYQNDFERNWYKLGSVNGSGIAGILADPDAHAQELGWIRGGDSPADAFMVRANNRSYRSRGVQAVLGHRRAALGADHSFEFGVRLHADDEDRFQWEDGYRMVNGRLVLSSEGTPGTQANRLAEASALALHLQDEIRLGRFTLTPGVRWESIDFTRTDWDGTDADRSGPANIRENDVTALIPGIGASWEWSPRLHFFGGVHRGFGPPGPGADADTRPEESLNVEAGLRLRRAGLGADVTAFVSDYSNILGRSTLATGGDGTGDLFNGGEVEVWGLEAAVDVELDRYLGLPFRMPVRTAYTLTRGTFGTSFESGYGPWGTVDSGDRLPYQPEHSVSGTVGVEDAGRSLTFTWQGQSAMRTEAGTGPIPEGEGADAFVVLGLRGEWAIAGQGTLYAGVQNLADEQYVVSRRPAGARPGLPRTLFVGFRVTR